jgi:hypothetical protein
MYFSRGYSSTFNAGHIRAFITVWTCVNIVIVIRNYYILSDKLFDKFNYGIDVNGTFIIFTIQEV